jgi:hypothetical protein
MTGIKLPANLLSSRHVSVQFGHCFLRNVPMRLLDTDSRRVVQFHHRSSQWQTHLSYFRELRENKSNYNAYSSVYRRCRSDIVIPRRYFRLKPSTSSQTAFTRAGEERAFWCLLIKPNGVSSCFFYYSPLVQVLVG